MPAPVPFPPRHAKSCLCPPSWRPQLAATHTHNVTVASTSLQYDVFVEKRRAAAAGDGGTHQWRAWVSPPPPLQSTPLLSLFSLQRIHECLASARRLRRALFAARSFSARRHTWHKGSPHELTSRAYRQVLDVAPLSKQHVTPTLFEWEELGALDGPGGGGEPRAAAPRLPRMGGLLGENSCIDVCVQLQYFTSPKYR